MRFQDELLMLKPTNPCPVCGAETALAEIEPHPLHGNFEIHGYVCDRCGPIKSLVVLRSQPLQSMMKVQHRAYHLECGWLAEGKVTRYVGGQGRQNAEFIPD